MNVVERTYKVADKGNTQVKYLRIIVYKNSTLVNCAEVHFHLFDTKFYFYGKWILVLNIDFLSSW